MNEAFGKDFFRKGNSVKRSRRFSEPLDSEKRKVAVLIPFPKSSCDAIASLAVAGLDQKLSWCCAPFMRPQC